MKLDYCAVHSGALIAPGSEPNCLFIRYDDGRIMTSKEVWAEIERLRAEILRLKRADDEATRLAITCSDLRAERAALLMILDRAICLVGSFDAGAKKHYQYMRDSALSGGMR